MLSATAQSLVDRARLAADAVTTTQASDFETDAEVLGYLNDAGRQLTDLILNNGASDLLGAVATLTAPSYALPAETYRVQALKQSINSRWVAMPLANFHSVDTFQDPNRPAWRITGSNALLLFPSPVSTSLGSLQLWYVPTFTDLLIGGTLNTFGGWDNFVVLSMAVAMVAREDRDTNFLRSERDRAEKRVIASCQLIRAATPETVANTAWYDELLLDYPYWR